MERYQIKEAVQTVWYYVSKMLFLILAVFALMFIIACITAFMEIKADKAQKEAALVPKTCVVLEVKHRRGGYMGMCRSTELQTEHGAFYLDYKSCPEADNLEKGDTITYEPRVHSSTNRIIVHSVKKG